MRKIVDFVFNAARCLVPLLLCFVLSAAPSQPVFAQRGYYITFMRATTFDLNVWKGIVDAVHADSGNVIILWTAGGFPSRKFPVTWQYNAEHKNVRLNFERELIDYAHSLGIKVLLGLTPFGYDGTNQYPLEHPELKAIDNHGNFVKAFGLGAWGFNMNPYREESQQFMLDYVREMFFDFYPNADGLLLESSDYAVSYCEGCKDTYYQKEFQFVRKISDEVWARKPDATVAVYPHYFNGADVPRMGVKGAHEKFDPRWTLFFTPHSAYIDPALVKQAKSSFYWDSSPTYGDLKSIQSAAIKARNAGVSGYVPSFEPWTYVLDGPDMGNQFLVGKRLSPFGFGWLKAGETPVNEILMRANRIAYREFSRNPDLSFEAFKTELRKELFGAKATPELIDDFLFLEESFFIDREWVSVAPLASPDYVKSRLDMGKLSPARLADYRTRLKRIGDLALRYSDSTDGAIQEMRSVAQWISVSWSSSPNRKILDDYLR